MRLIIYCTMLFMLGIVALQSSVYAEDFSADVITNTPEGSFTAKIYASGNKSRMESAGAITISRMDKNIVWILMPTEKMYMEQPVNPRTAASVQEKVNGEIERSTEGTETINGVKTTKYRITVETQGRRESIFQWIDEAMRFPIKTAAIDGSWSSEFRNISRKAQDPQLFEIPAGYTKMAVGMPDIKALMNNAGKSNEQ